MNYLKKSFPYLAAPILALTVFFLYFNLWNFDLNKPLFNNYDWDVLLHAFFAKTIVDNGWFLVNDYVGFPQLDGPFNLYDFPLQASSFNLLIFKFFAYFTNNPFLILNLYFLTTIILVALFTFIALRNFGVSVFSSLLIAILYDFIIYHINRSIFHCFLTNYSLIPLVVMAGNWILEGKINILGLNKKQQYSLQPNKYFFFLLLIGAMISTNDIYYAIYSCIFLMICLVAKSLREEKFIGQNFAGLIFYFLTVLAVLLIVYFPSLKYWITHKVNKFGTIRSAAESESFALRIVDLFIPSKTHFIEYFSNIREFFDTNVILKESSSVYERSCEALGLLGSFGFLFLMLWVFSSAISNSQILKRTINKLSLKTKDIALFSNLGVINLFTVLFATTGGFVMLMVPFFSALRAHARFLPFIAFISFLAVAIIFDRFLEKNIFRKKIYSYAILLSIAVLALFDQLGNPKSLQYHNPDFEKTFISDKNFVAEIENKIPEKSRIFILPLDHFPESSKYENLLGYLHSQNLLWSYPVMRGRASEEWQKETEKLEFEKLIKALKENNFDGVMVNRIQLAKKFAKNILKDPAIKTDFYNRCQMKNDTEGVRQFEEKLAKISKLKIISADEKFSFYKL